MKKIIVFTMLLVLGLSQMVFAENTRKLDFLTATHAISTEFKQDKQNKHTYHAKDGILFVVS